MPAAIKKLIAELGFRYRPTSRTDLEAHAAVLALLASDLRDIPAHLLEKAIAKHVLESPYLPKASDLVRLAKSFIPPRQTYTAGPEKETLADRYNRTILAESGRTDIIWRMDSDGNAYLTSNR